MIQHDREYTTFTCSVNLASASEINKYSSEIRSAVLLIHGEKAHSRYFSEDAFKRLKGDNKELMVIPGASHVDLYDRVDVIPFDKMAEFFAKYFSGK